MERRHIPYLISTDRKLHYKLAHLGQANPSPCLCTCSRSQFAGFIGISVVVLMEWVKNGGLGGGIGDADSGRNTKISGLPVTLNRSTVYLLLLIAAFSLLVASVYLMLVRAFTRMVMHVTLVLSILLNVSRVGSARQ